MKNDGLSDREYSFGDDDELNARLSALLNEICHVFRLHADGHWKSEYKPKYAKRLAEELRVRRSLIRKLLALQDPVVSNVTHAAIELLNGEAAQD